MFANIVKFNCLYWHFKVMVKR